MPPKDATPLGDEMAENLSEPRFPERIATPEVPAPESVPPVNNPDPQPDDPKPKAPPSQDESGHRVVPIELPGNPHAPERVTA